MTATFEEAQDEVYGLFKTAWDTTGFIALYPNVAGSVPTTPTPWARAKATLFNGGDASLSGALGTRRYERQGLFTAQIFVPAGEGLERAMQLAKIVVDAYDGQRTASGIWFRNARVADVGPDGDWYQVNVLVNYEFDEIK